MGLTSVIEQGKCHATGGQAPKYLGLGVMMSGARTLERGIGLVVEAVVSKF